MLDAFQEIEKRFVLVDKELRRLKSQLGQIATGGTLLSSSMAAHGFLSSQHADTDAAGPLVGALVVGNATPVWSRLATSVPAANVRNVLGLDNGDTIPAWKSALDATNPANIAAVASPGTSLIFSHRDHVHAHPTFATGDLHTEYVTKATLTVNGDLFYRAAGVVTRLPIGTNTFVLTVVAGAPAWAAAAATGAPATARYFVLGQDATLSNEISVSTSDFQAINKRVVYAFDAAATDGLQFLIKNFQVAESSPVGLTISNFANATLDMVATGGGIIKTFTANTDISSTYTVGASYNYTVNGINNINLTWNSFFTLTNFNFSMVTGANRFTMKLGGLPTADPNVVDQIYTDNNYLRRSAGGGVQASAFDVQYVVLAATAVLANERVLTAGTNISLTDAGAGSTITVAVKDQVTLARSDLTIAAGVITVTKSHHRVDTEAAAATDDLDTINGGVDNAILILRPVSGARTIVIRHNIGNIKTVGGASITLDDAEDWAWLIYDGTATTWYAIMGSGTGSGTSLTVQDEDATPAVGSVDTIVLGEGRVTDLGSGDVYLEVTDEWPLDDLTDLTDGATVTFNTFFRYELGTLRVIYAGLVLRAELDYTEDTLGEAFTLTFTPAADTELQANYKAVV